LNKGLLATVILLAAAGAATATAALQAGHRSDVARAAQPVVVAGSVTGARAEGGTAPAAGSPAAALNVLNGTDPLQPPPEVDVAPVAMLVDWSSGRTLYARDIDRHFLPASVTKVMTLYVAFDLMAQGKLSPGQMVTVSDGAWREWHAKGSRMFLERGSRVSVDQLLMGIANVSANDGCVVLAEGATGSVGGWVALMNAEARAIGMRGSHFNTPNGWMDEGQTYYTARDLSKLADAMLTRFPQYYHRYIGHSEMTWNGITQRNHDPTIGIVPGADGIKTGFTDEAKYTFLGSAERDGRRLVMVLATVPTAWQRAKAARALLEWGFSAWDSRRLFAAGEQVGHALVQQGDAAQVALLTPRAYFATTRKGRHEPVTMRLIYKGPLTAPIAKGSEVAELEVRIGDDAPIRMPLLAANAVARGNAFNRLRNGLTELLR
jgi:D-alanyl-D-alanine carboxypeptidase (penicillin-binding protein 5/6)